MFKSLVALTALATAGVAQAAVVTLFSDDFEAEGPANTLNYDSFANWTVFGQVDLVGMPNGFGISCSGNCVDLDGTNGPGAIKSNGIAIKAGQEVSISFDVSGSQRPGGIDEFSFFVTVGSSFDIAGGEWNGLGFGVPLGAEIEWPGAGFSGLLPSNQPWATSTFTFLPTTAGTIFLSFSTTSADAVGPLIDNVLVTQGAVPEPATWAMLITGFGLVGFAARRRRAQTA